MVTQFKPRTILALWLILVLAACTGQSQARGTYVWIDVPVDGLSLADVQPVNIEGHASSPAGISHIEIRVNGELFTTLRNPPADNNLNSFQASWTAPGPGEYTLQTIAFSSDGATSQPDSAVVRFGASVTSPSPTLVPSVTPSLTRTRTVTATPVPVTDTPTLPPTLTPTFTPTALPKAIIQFWAEPPELEAGACTLLRWHVENVQSVSFGGKEQPFDGSYKDCLCSSQHFSLGIVLLDGTKHVMGLDVPVSGSCVTPVPPEDTTPPPAPDPAVPADGLSLSCRANQSLAWLPVTDKSGIAQYQVEVNRSSNQKTWAKTSGSPLTGINGKTVSIPVECGWYYRWRVRAVDGKGNVGAWSAWSRFNIPLS